ncbi:VOC family protein [Jiulongibacter sediminis]|uniref:Glyoxalase n=1 Tax=Jiulongibacter sediminis TaxID=1605367 RepID=A0A0P7BCH7_9BACT|nr:VOC family protein [Jiulongibacter sediminis]KPM48283.1 glyoxalase [Jiulongibacter sediminis]TBX24824.1 glyoxalase [Jiulongibacter sediminis]
MAKTIGINHVTLIVKNLEEACAFYENELGLEVIPAFLFDYPTAFFRVNETEQLHLTEWDEEPSFRGHVCFHMENINEVYWRMKELGIIDISPWGKARVLPDGPLQFFIRDPSGNLVELSCPPGTKIDPKILEDDLYQDGIYVSGRNDFRGYKSKDATLYHESK